MKLFFGLLGMIMVQGSTLFQIVKFYRFRKTEGVSIGFWWVLVCGLGCYLVYSLLIKDPIYTVANLLGIILALTNIFLYYRFRRLK